jgi:hypothetical protein
MMLVAIEEIEPGAEGETKRSMLHNRSCAGGAEPCSWRMYHVPKPCVSKFSCTLAALCACVAQCVLITRMEVH